MRNIDLHESAAGADGGPVLIVDLGEDVGGRGICPAVGKGMPTTVFPIIGSLFGGANVDRGFFALMFSNIGWAADGADRSHCFDVDLR